MLTPVVVIVTTPAVPPTPIVILPLAVAMFTLLVPFAVEYADVAETPVN